jgi:hypothetical protein
MHIISDIEIEQLLINLISQATIDKYSDFNAVSMIASNICLAK